MSQKTGESPKLTIDITFTQWHMRHNLTDHTYFCGVGFSCSHFRPIFLPTCIETNGKILSQFQSLNVIKKGNKSKAVILEKFYITI